MSAWQPVEFAPQDVTLLCRSGCNLYFAGCRDGVWRLDSMRVVVPALWLEEAL